MPANLRINDGSIDMDDHISYFIGAVNQGEWQMLIWYRMFQQTLDGPARGWFDRIPNGCINNKADLQEKFVERQLEAALVSRKLSHLVKDVKRRGNTKGRQQGNNNDNGKVINMDGNVSDEPLIIEAEVEGYLVRRVFIDQGAAVQVMFEHCFNILPPSVKERLTSTQTELVGFFREQLISVGKIKLDLAFRSEGVRIINRVRMMLCGVRWLTGKPTDHHHGGGGERLREREQREERYVY
uniref:Reverse transcriptase domain-containing protein n=1 Tax=Tanacetum cinerariifolium TaxID=118510 RepID=A0A6L2LQW1_TANCI|nr:reverse transcriptase domain-containing protein [Tanacetum cinerariifolium]